MGYFGYWCGNGHDKGAFYDPKSDDTDQWGYPLAVDAGAKGAKKCLRVFSEPRDMYELSNVILGAQYNAAIDKLPMEALVKSANDLGIPTIGLSKDEAEAIPFKHEPKRVSDARLKGAVKIVDDGSLTWVEDGMLFSYDPENPEEGISSLGRANNNKEASDAGSGALSSGVRSEGGDGVEDSGVHDGDDGVERGVEDHAAAELELEGSESGTPGSLTNKGEDSEEEEDDEESEDSSSSDDAEDKGEDEGDDEDLSDPDADEDDPDEEVNNEEVNNEEVNNEEDKAVTRSVVMAHAKALKAAGTLPESVVDAVKEAEGNGLDALLEAFGTTVKGLRDQNAALTVKAAKGEEFISELKKEVLDWYVKARQTDDRKKVSVESVEKLIGLAGDDTDLLKAMIEEQKELAQAKFPAAVRRSSFPSDPNVSDGIPALKGSDDSAESDVDEGAKRAARRHL